ncbi:MAG TPA: multicopper oxidase domain-containing protein [Rhizomicrobium sp.]|jgi:FtsP/CotA-like multicopper oxidase with cupredoxin domain|nr:multicopper oxidase domain-containing protein [Rhizomicrobium sp.]
MRAFPTRLRTAVLSLLLLLALPYCALAASDPCPRPVQGSVIVNPPDLYSQDGVLKVTFDYYTTLDQWGRTLFCYVTPHGMEAPTLHLNPGDTIDLTLTNKEQGGPPPVLETVSGKSNVCGSFYMTPQSVNLHFHGMNVSPRCHADDVINTLVNPGESFHYEIRIPKDEPPGMYWYHQHVHGISSPGVEGGASGAIEVEGIANLQPAVAGLPQRFLVLRDEPLQNPPQNQQQADTVPYWDVSTNFVSVPYPKYPPGIIKMRAGAQEFWRVVNAAANTQMDLQVLYDGVAQPLQIVAFDGVPTGSQDGKQQGTIITQTDVFIPVAGRAEFIVIGPSKGVKTALLMTKRIDTGPGGDIDTRRPLAKIQLTNDMREIPKSILPLAGHVSGDRFAGVDDSMVTAHRHLYFSEITGTGKVVPGGGSIFYITVVGQNPVVYYPDEPPAITTTQGAVEDWTIENRAHEVHEFHMHQIHFQLLAVDGVPVPPERRQWYDTYQVDYDPCRPIGETCGHQDGRPYPSIKVRMDFRGADVGEFVYHCHILDHEDKGMMANILVLPRGSGSNKGAALQRRPLGAKLTKVGSRSIGAHAS